MTDSLPVQATFEDVIVKVLSEHLPNRYNVRCLAFRCEWGADQMVRYPTMEAQFRAHVASELHAALHTAGLLRTEGK